MNPAKRSAESINVPGTRLEHLTPQQHARLAALKEAARPAVQGSLHSRFESEAARRPSAVAVSCGDAHFTYAELNQRAGALARRLVAEGPGLDLPVAIVLPRGLNLVVAILAVLKAGMAYLPVDPSVPTERLDFILEDAGARLILTDARYASQTVRGPNCWLLDAADAFHAPHGVVLPDVDSAALAYVIYTSGSTGQPKGVMIEHRQVLRLFSSADQRYTFSEDDVWCLFHSYAFDVSVWEIWGALLYGARLVIVPHEMTRSPVDFAALLRRESVTVLNQTPTAFANLMPVLMDEQGCGALRYVVFAGEALEPRRLVRWFERFGDEGPQMVNMYGITETTVHVTFKLIGPAQAATGVSDIGEPLADLTLYLLNERLRSVPPGATGELYIAGPGLARGYLNRPELNAARFIDNPFTPGERMYKTGDLARRLDGGVLEYMGRNDSQIKLRGFRIELGDIERQLLGHPAVIASVAALHGEGDERRLVAYVVLTSNASDWKGALYRHLAATLPEYMVPAYLIALPALPLTVNGKIARAQLPAPSGNDAWTRGYIAPRNEAERILCGLYGELLKVGQVGIDDNFFSLGGDSIRTVNLVAGAAAAGLHFSTADIFAHPCVIDLAQIAVTAQVSHATGSTVVEAAVKPGSIGAFDLISDTDRALLPADVCAAYPMSRLQQGMVFHNLASSDNSVFHNVINQRYRGALDLQRMRRAIEDVMGVHDILRTSLHMIGFSEPLQLVHARLPAPLFYTDLCHMAPADQESFLSAALARLRETRLDLHRAPLFQAHLYRLADDVIELTWLEHHAILDGWSLSSFMAQLTERYIALAAPDPAPLTTPIATYRDFIAAEQRAIAHPEHAAFWRGYLQDAPYTELQGGRRDAGGRRIAPLPLAPELFEACRELAISLGVPIKSIFAAAYAKTISKFSGEAKVTLGMAIHGRPETQDSGAMLGLYVSSQPLRLDCGRATWRELIRRCFHAEAAIWPRRFYPLTEIMRLQDKGALFETAFTYNHFSVTDDVADIGLQAMRERRSFEFDDAPLSVAVVVSDLKAAVCHVHVSFAPEKFDAGFAQRIQECVLLALARMAAGVDQSADVLGHKDAAIAAQLANWVPSVQPGDSLLAEFQALAASQPDACAIEQGECSLTYAALDARAARMAGRLLQLGIGHGSLVGFDTIPSINMVTALLALFKTGAVFMPLDPDQSPARLLLLIEGSDVQHIVADSNRWAGQVPGTVALHLLPELAVADAPPAPPMALSPGDGAYTIFTSGSTGRPKGVPITHGNAVSNLRAIAGPYTLQPGTRVLQVSNIGFDLFMQEMICSLFNGGTLVLRPTPRLPDATEFWELVDSKRINLVSLATGYWNLLCAELPQQQRATNCTLHTCGVGGEAMQRGLLERWLRHWGDSIRVIHAYGPTEATITTTAFDALALAREPRRYGAIPIGRPLTNSPCWILIKDGSPAPVGVAGELFIGGEAVSPGYLNLPEETAHRFLEAGALEGVMCRVYRTGDMVRALEDGNIEFIGRLDGQVKIRGFRVEVDEICQVIGAEPTVRQCIVVPVSDGGETRLAAYVVLEDGCSEADQHALKQRVHASLPGYMRLAAFIRMDALPMTPNRKIDVKALPQPRFHVEEAYVAPVDELETRLQAAWATVLERDAISVEADFFALGGHSLLLTRVLMRISQEFSVELSMAELMRTRTVRAMASLIRAAHAVAAAGPDHRAGKEEVVW